MRVGSWPGGDLLGVHSGRGYHCFLSVFLSFWVCTFGVNDSAIKLLCLLREHNQSLSLASGFFVFFSVFTCRNFLPSFHIFSRVGLSGRERRVVRSAKPLVGQ